MVIHPRDIVVFVEHNMSIDCTYDTFLYRIDSLLCPMQGHYLQPYPCNTSGHTGTNLCTFPKNMCMVPKHPTLRCILKVSLVEIDAVLPPSWILRSLQKKPNILQYRKTCNKILMWCINLKFIDNIFSSASIKKRNFSLSKINIFAVWQRGRNTK